MSVLGDKLREVAKLADAAEITGIGVIISGDLEFSLGCAKSDGCGPDAIWNVKALVNSLHQNIHNKFSGDERKTDHAQT